MLPDGVSNPGPVTYESGALLIALRGPADYCLKGCKITSYPSSVLLFIREHWHFHTHTIEVHLFC